MSEAITGGVDRCNVRRMRDRLQQAKAKNLCPSSTGDPKPTGKGTAIDSMDKVREFWNRHCVSPSFEMLTRRVMFPELALQVALWGGVVLKP